MVDSSYRIQLLELDHTGRKNVKYKWFQLEYELDVIVYEYEFISYIAGVMYVLLTFLIPRLMKNRTEFKLSAISVCWYTLLLTLNAITVGRIAPHILFILHQRGFYVSICVDRWVKRTYVGMQLLHLLYICWSIFNPNTWIFHITCVSVYYRSFIGDDACAFWLVMFPFLKILELGDTVLLSLQKRQVTTYYWTHHLIALLGSWFLYPYYPSIGLWMVLIISVSHVPVYAYMLVRELLIPLPRFCSTILIIAELMTMLTGTVYGIFASYYIATNRPCDIPIVIVTVSNVLFMSCFIICSVFFYQRCRRQTGKVVLNTCIKTNAAVSFRTNRDYL